MRETGRGRRLPHVRRAWLVSQFGPEAAQRIAAGQIWKGATAEMVIAALGQPALVDERVLKTKRKHVFKYGQLSAKRFALKVKLDDGVVVGWDGELPSRGPP